MKNKIISLFIALNTVLYTLAAVFLPVCAAENTITLKSVDDFISFSKLCRLDTASVGKTVSLACDIDFSGCDFIPVASFSGTFNGNGYTLYGISINEKGSYFGVFRYVGQGGKISSLNVKANVTPRGSKSFIGGIAGENSGTLENCSFTGSVKGENVIGGIAGENTEYGKVISCTASGNVTGENSTGGIVGKNSGFIQNCTNNSAVNTVYEEKKANISDIDADIGAIIENRKNTDEENEEESVLGHTDTGGISGSSSGIIQGCKNNASVGYKHVGYNVGGISGRQSGYILGCENFGEICGRKDIGGISGQAEPFILLNPSENSLKNIRSELTDLNSMVNRLITDTDSFGDDAEKYLNSISDLAKTASDSAHAMINDGTDFIDDNLSEINAEAAILSNALDNLSAAFEKLESGGNEISDALNTLCDTLDGLKISAPDLSSEIDEISSALLRISQSEKSIRKSVSKLNKAIDDLKDAVSFKNISDTSRAVTEIIDAIDEIMFSNQAIEAAVGDIKSTVSKKPESFEDIGINAGEIAQSLKTIAENTKNLIKAYKAINKGLGTILTNTKIDISAFSSAAINLDYASGYLLDALHYISTGLSDLSKGLTNASDNLSAYLDDTEEELNTAKDGIVDGLNKLSYAFDDISEAIGDMKDIAEDLSDEKPLEFVKLGDGFKEESENLYNSLSGISDELSGLKDRLSTERKSISHNLTSISNKFTEIMNMFIGELEELNDLTLSEKTVDISDENIESVKQGKIEKCQNHGKISADRNTGGIAGAMAIEYLKDPEDDIEKPNTLNFTYKTGAVLHSCINEGEVIGKKDCTGGIVGSAELGTVYKCENYGNTESANGKYVGGIAGKSGSSVRKSYSKAKIKGLQFVGGIAGKANNASANYAIVSVSGDENTGAVLGDSESNENLYRNFFVDNGIGGVDGISYSQKAEPISFDELKSTSGIPSRFISFTVTFIADDEIISEKEMEYGEPTAKIKYPDIPEKNGYFGKWIKPNIETVSEDIDIICEYSPYITVLSSKEKNENGKLALALCEGEFTDSAKLSVSDSNQIPPIKKEDNVRVYNITLKNTDLSENDDVTLRLLNENKDNVTAWILKNGSWQKIKTTNNGKYVTLKTTGTQNTVCLKYEPKNKTVLKLSLTLALALLATFAILKIKRRKKTQFERA